MDILAGHSRWFMPSAIGPKSRLVVHHKDLALELVLLLVLEDHDVLLLEVGQRHDVRLLQKEALLHDAGGLQARADTSQHMGVCAPLTRVVLGATHLLSCGVLHLSQKELAQQLLVQLRAQPLDSRTTRPAGAHASG